MNKEAVFDFIKKNLLSLICGVVALLAIVAIFYPIGGMMDGLHDTAVQHANNYQALSLLTAKPRKLPVTDPSKSLADDGDLTVFPNAALIKAGEDIDAKLIDQSSKAIAYVKDLSARGHQLLVPAVLPDAQSQTTALKFAEVYTKVLSPDPAVTGIGDPKATPPVNPDQTLLNFKAMNLQNDILHGTMPPTPKEIEDASDKLWHEVYEPRIYTRNGAPVNDVEVKQEFAEAKAKLPRQLKAEVARKKKIYVELRAFEQNPNISVNVAPAAVDIWYAQNALWIQQDIAQAIADANAQSTNILDAQVKRLISLQIAPVPMVSFPPASGDAMAGAAGGVPSPATETQPLPVAYTVSPTGRASNGMYDVIHFTLLIDVDAKHVNDVIQAFSRGRLISIYRQDLYALDTGHEASLGYLYGDSRVVRLQLQGEILFLRSWTTAWMPDRIKQAMGLLPPAGGAGGLPVNPMNPNGGLGGTGGLGGHP